MGYLVGGLFVVSVFGDQIGGLHVATGIACTGVPSTFNIAIYEFSEKGAMAQAEVAGTKYWKAGKLSRPAGR